MDGVIGILTGRGPACDELQAWLDTLQPYTPEQVLRVMGNQIAYQRNAVVRYAMERGYPYVLFVDNDCVPPPGALDRLLSHRLPIVSGACVERVAPFDICAIRNTEPYQRYTAADLAQQTEAFPVVSAGAGCLLVQREVFEKLDAPWFRCGQIPGAPDVLSEDLDFCQRAAEIGFPVYLDPLVLVGHVVRVLLTPGADGQLWGRWDGPLGPLHYAVPMGEAMGELHL